MTLNTKLSSYDPLAKGCIVDLTPKFSSLMGFNKVESYINKELGQSIDGGEIEVLYVLVHFDNGNIHGKVIHELINYNLVIKSIITHKDHMVVTAFNGAIEFFLDAMCGDNEEPEDLDEDPQIDKY